MSNRLHMLRDIKRGALLTAVFTGRKYFSAAVMRAMAKVPRDRFVPSEYREDAWYDGPLPIGFDQTISQPYMVALMTDLLDLRPDDVVLEIGTGCGYQCAVLAEVAAQVYSLERVAPLHFSARQRLQALGYDNVECRLGDGYQGWPEQAPFDAIMVTAAPPAVPPALLAQLKPGGRLVIPIGQPYASQHLMRIEKDRAGRLQQEDILSVAFVPMLAGEA